MKRKEYEAELRKLHAELVAMQEWVKASGAKVCVVFEGRDSAGKGGTIKAITEKVSPRVFRVVALPSPTEREKSQMYIQRYVPHLPAAGEVVIFDRSWYNRAGVERVMGFCTEEQAQRFLDHGARRRAGDRGLGRDPAQVLARGRRGRADEAPPEPHRRPPQGLEAVRHGPPVVHPVARLHPLPRRHVRGHRHRRGRRGTSCAPTTSGAGGSTSSPTCSARSPTSLWTTATSRCPNARAPATMRRRRSAASTSRRRSEPGRVGPSPEDAVPSRRLGRLGIGQARHPHGDHQPERGRRGSGRTGHRLVGHDDSWSTRRRTSLPSSVTAR